MIFEFLESFLYIISEFLSNVDVKELALDFVL